MAVILTDRDTGPARIVLAMIAAMSRELRAPFDLESLQTWREASTAGSAIAAALDVARSVPPTIAATLRDADRIVLTGAGSSYYVALTAAAVGRETTGLPFVAAPLSEVMLRPNGVFGRTPGREPLVVISRSGSTSEALTVAQWARAFGHPLLGVTCRAASPLAHLVDQPMVVPAGDESAIAMTRSFASMLALLLRVISDLDETGRLGADLDASPERWADAVAAAAVGRRLGETSWSAVVVLGGGPAFGIASEWGLKLTETSQVPAYAYQPLEFRHGPISLCEPGVLVIGLLGGAGAREEARVLRESAALGADTWALSSDSDVAAGATGHVTLLGAGLHPSARLPLLLYPAHALALSLALTRGRDPDAPRHLGQVVVIAPE